MARFLLVAAALLSACSPALELPDGALVSCGSDADCPGGYICRSTLGRCVRPGGDVTAPELVTASFQVTPLRVGTGTAAVTVSFQVSEALAADPQASLVLSGSGNSRPLTVVSKDAVAHSYVLSYTPVPGSDPEGPVSFDATFIDAAGNQGHAGLPQVAVFDFTPPALAEDLAHNPIASVTLTPPVTSPVRDVTAVTVGTRLQVDFAAAEPLAGDAASPVVKLGSGAAAVTLTQVSGNGLSYVYQTVVAAGLPEGPAALSAHLTDLAGNGADVSLGTVPVLTQRPASPAVNTADAILFHRVPWGSEATQGTQAFYLRGAAGAVPGGSYAIAYSDPTVVSAAGVLVGREVARTAAGATGAFGGDVGDPAPFQLFMGDSPDLYIAAVDAAGNVSDADGNPSNGLQAALVRDVAWTATMLGKIPGRIFPNPHGFEGREVWTPTLAQQGAKPLATPAQVGRQEGTRASVRGAPYWLPARAYAPLGARGGTALVNDPVRGCRVAFSGQGWDGCDSGFYCSQWESCRGGPWFQPVVDDPEGDGNPALGTGQPLVFAGGRGASVLANGADLWEWGGSSWRKIVMADPEGDGNPVARTGQAIAYDEARQRVILFGGTAVAGGALLSDLWETDFHSWRQLCTTAPCSTTRPAARFAHAMVYDPVHKNVLLVGGQLTAGFDAATWTWDGTAWTSRCTSGTCAANSPAQRREHGLAFDPVRGRAVVFGGNSGAGALDGTFEWDGTIWTAVCTTAPCSLTRPDLRSSPSLFHDPDRGRIVMFGGTNGNFGGECSFSPFCGTEWEWSGTAWTQVIAPAAFPPSVRDVTPVYDPVRDRVLLFGGFSNFTFTYTNATWLWDNGRSLWSNPAVAVPSIRSSYAATWVPTGASAGNVLLFGGYDSVALGGSFLWNGAGWSGTGGATPPSVRRWAGIAQSVQAVPPGGAFLFGGEDGAGTVLCEQSQFSGAAWSAPACPGSPTARRGQAMVRAPDFTGAPIVMFGGTTGGGAGGDLNDTWHYNGAWTRISAGGTASPTQPNTRVGHGLLYDTGRRRVLLFGGAPSGVTSNVNCVDDYGGIPCHDFWEWDGSAWTRVFPVDLYGDGNPDPGQLEGVAFDTTRRQGVGIVGPPGNTTVQTWIWHGGPEDRPAQVMSVVFDAAEVTRPFDVLDLDVTWVGGASGTPAGTVTPGASLQLWDNRAWRTLATSPSATPAAPAALHWTLGGDAQLGAIPLAERQRFMVGDQRLLELALVPLAASGSASGFGEVSTDYAEVTVRYRLAP